MSHTFAQVAQAWKADKRQWVKPSTYAAYVHHLNRHILQFFGPMTSEALSESAIQAYVNTLLSRSLGMGTIRDSLTVLKMVLRHGVKMGAWSSIDFEVHFPSASVRKTEIQILSAPDQKRLMTYLQDHFSFRNLGILICLHSGLRIGEICGLQWKDLDIAAGVIHVTKTVQRIWLSDFGEKAYTLSIDSPKTITSRRDIPLSRDLIRLIRPLRKLMDQDHYVVSNGPEPLEPRYYRDYYKKTIVGLGLLPTRFHALRHSFATRCIESKCDYKTVSVLLGHASISTTLDLYVHPGYLEKKKCIDRMARGLMGK